jgi:hypothetical protein
MNEEISVNFCDILYEGIRFQSQIIVTFELGRFSVKLCDGLSRFDIKRAFCFIK